MWDAATGEERHSLTGHSSGVNGCAVSLDKGYAVYVPDGLKTTSREFPD